jgi:hypothetical protein
MTSVIRSHFSGRSLPNPAQFICAYFVNSQGFNQPFPWRYNKQTQQLDLEYVDGFTNSTELRDTELFFRGQQFGGLHLVMGLGSKFIEWCENNGDIGADVGSVQLYEKPIVVNANMIGAGVDPGDAEGQERTYPISFENAAGTVGGKYCKTLVFMKPMVITYTREGTRYYRWFNQGFEGND